MIIFEIKYSNERLIRPVQDWTKVRAEDVQQVAVGVPGVMTVLQGHSLYWLYPEGNFWVVGSGSVRYDKNPITEIVIALDGTQTERQIEYMPDLRLNQIKLGWWQGWPRPII